MSNVGRGWTRDDDDDQQTLEATHHHCISQALHDAHNLEKEKIQKKKMNGILVIDAKKL
jgi:hypothetical protein